jgi:HPr kinase/phosphorylase
MSKTVNIHATCVRLDGEGVLLLGESGAGKSDLALRLITRGAKLVSDDRCDLHVERGILVARAPKTVGGLFEVRGLGIVELRHAASARISLVVDLSAPVERMPEPHHYAPPRPLMLRQSAQPRLIALSAFETSAADKIIAALRFLPLKGRRSVKRRRKTVKRN